YPKEWAFEGRAWNEAYLLRAFLEYNHAFRIRFFTDYMMRKYSSTFESKFPLCLKHPPGSIWLEKTEHDTELNRVSVLDTRRTKPAPFKVEPARAEYRWALGDGWYSPEDDHCWMQTEAFLRIAGPQTPGRKLVIRGYSPHPDGAQIRASIEGLASGS